jgi:hypothetical protein
MCVGVQVFGGMRSQNTDAEWLDMRQAVISEGFIRLGNATGRQDLMERGVAAARASLSLSEFLLFSARC